MGHELKKYKKKKKKEDINMKPARKLARENY